jgi:hypothetical protein
MLPYRLNSYGENAFQIEHQLTIKNL